ETEALHCERRSNSKECCTQKGQRFFNSESIQMKCADQGLGQEKSDEGRHDTERCARCISAHVQQCAHEQNRRHDDQYGESKKNHPEKRIRRAYVGSQVNQHSIALFGLQQTRSCPFPHHLRLADILLGCKVVFPHPSRPSRRARIVIDTITIVPVTTKYVKTAVSPEISGNTFQLMPM